MYVCKYTTNEPSRHVDTNRIVPHKAAIRAKSPSMPPPAPPPTDTISMSPPAGMRDVAARVAGSSLLSESIVGEGGTSVFSERSASQGPQRKYKSKQSHGTLDQSYSYSPRREAHVFGRITGDACGQILLWTGQQRVHTENTGASRINSRERSSYTAGTMKTNFRRRFRP